MSSFRARLLGRQEEQEVLYETITELNVRGGPGTEHPTVQGSPLPTATRVEILNREGGWAFIDVVAPVGSAADIQGWVNSRFLRRIG